MSKRLLVLAASGVSPQSAGRMIDRHYGGDVQVHLVAPASSVSRLEWLTTDVAEQVRTDAVETEVGDTDPVQAIHDALATFEADEIVVLTCPEDKTTWLEQGTAEEARERFDVPVRHLVID